MRLRRLLVTAALATAALGASALPASAACITLDLNVNGEEVNEEVCLPGLPA